jgi:hypothetical protein
MNHKDIAKQLRLNRFKTYPSGSTARSQALAMIQDLNKILEVVRDHEDVPPWVVMKLSESKNAIDSVANYVSYYGQKGL